MSAEEVAGAFINHYYSTLTQGADALVGLYQPTSMLSFEGEQHQGPQAIIHKLKSIGPCAHEARSMDVQPSTSEEAMVIFVTGTVRIGSPDANPLLFSETFQLVANGPGSYYVHNQLHRLNYGL